MVALNSVMSTK